MENFKLIMFNINAVPAVFAGVLLTVLVNAFVETSFPKNGFKIVLLPLYFFFAALVIYTTTAKYHKGNMALHEVDANSIVLAKFKAQYPNEAQLYLQMKEAYKNNDCILCGRNATYGIATHQTGQSTKYITPNKVLVCQDHTEFIKQYIDKNKAYKNTFVEEYCNTTKFYNIEAVDKKTVKIMSINIIEAILESLINGRNIDISHFAKDVPISKEAIFSDIGFYIWMLLTSSVLLIFIGKNSYNKRV